jgi:membrane protein DedA with SNARE-associated domain
MSRLRVLIEHYGLLVVFAAVLLSRMGIPVPAFPVLLTAAAITSGSARAVGGLALAGAAGGLIADLGWFTASRRLAALC